MNTTRAALLLFAAILAGCATQPKQRTDATQSRGFAPALERPGLGTSWGEQRESWVEPAPFARASAERPTEQARIYYNDRDGANAMLAFLRSEPRQADGLQPKTGGMLRLGLRNGNGAWLDCRESHAKRIATGECGERYEVVLKNDARRAIEVLVSVDGLDAMDGKPASFKKRGYVLAPFETLAVEGFRTSRSTVAAFRFGSMSDSYGHRRHGDTTNAGVIGVAVFEEKRHPPAAGGSAATDHAWRATATRPADDRRNFSTPPEA
jgi:hypothetical protein